MEFLKGMYTTLIGEFEGYLLSNVWYLAGNQGCICLNVLGSVFY